MGRAKLNMELISKEKSRNITFKKRKEGLIRKMHEFTTLCDVSACMIIYGPEQDKPAIEPEICPQNVDEVRRIIDIYKSKNKDSSSSNNKTFGLSDFFHDRKRKIGEELAKLKRKNMEAKYPTSIELMNYLTEAQLREFAAQLSNKAEYVKSRIQMLRRSRDTSLMDFGRMSQLNPFYTPGFINQQQQAISHIHMQYPITDQKNQDFHSVMNQSSMMRLLMNENDDNFMQFGGGGTSPSPGGNIQCAASFKGEVFYETGRDPPMICANKESLARYYPSPLMPPVMPPPCMMQGNAVPLGLTFSRENYQEEGGGGGGLVDVFQYFMNNNVRARFHDLA